MPGTAPLAVDIAIEGVHGVRRAAATVPHDAEALGRGGASATRSSTRSALPGEGAETEVFFSDLGHEYVTINADYTT